VVTAVDRAERLLAGLAEYGLPGSNEETQIGTWVDRHDGRHTTLIWVVAGQGAQAKGLDLQTEFLTRALVAAGRIPSAVLGKEKAVFVTVHEGTTDADRDALNKIARRALANVKAYVDTLSPDRVADLAIFTIKIEQALQGKLPAWVRDITCQLGPDASGDPALWVWLDVAPEVIDKPQFAKEVPEVSDKVFEAAQNLNVGLWTYVRFRSVEEKATTSSGVSRS
jgi:hypothetical protein